MKKSSPRATHTKTLQAGELAKPLQQVDRTFVPANLAAGGKDVRELGLRVYHAFLEVR